MEFASHMLAGSIQTTALLFVWRSYRQQRNKVLDGELKIDLGIIKPPPTEETKHADKTLDEEMSDYLDSTPITDRIDWELHLFRKKWMKREKLFAFTMSLLYIVINIFSISYTIHEHQPIPHHPVVTLHKK